MENKVIEKFIIVERLGTKEEEKEKFKKKKKKNGNNI